MTETQFGGFWRRAVAYGVDQAILQIFYIILFILGILIQGADGALRRGMDMDGSGAFPDMGVIWIYYLVALFLDMAYFTWFHGSVGATPGKMLLGLRVVQASGEPLTFGLAFLRWVGSIVSKIILYLGFLWIAFDRRKQGWHDKIAATLVVMGKKGLDNESDII
jgi:uncharacterized RDD family membrane protein YckC